MGSSREKLENNLKVLCSEFESVNKLIVKLRQGSGKDGQGMALKAEGLKA